MVLSVCMGDYVCMVEPLMRLQGGCLHGEFMPARCICIVGVGKVCERVNAI